MPTTINEICGFNEKVKEEKEIIRLFRQTQDSKYLEILLERYDKYIIKVTTSIFLKHGSKYEYEDVKQEVILEFIRIVSHKFNLDKENAFFTYTFKVLKFASLNFIRDDKFFPIERKSRMKNFKGNVIFAAEVSQKFESDTDEKIVDYLIYKRKTIDYKEIHEYVEENVLLEKVKNLLTKLEYRTLYEYIVLEKSQTLIAKERGTNQTAISKMIINSIKKIEENIPLY